MFEMTKTALSDNSTLCQLPTLVLTSSQMQSFDLGAFYVYCPSHLGKPSVSLERLVFYPRKWLTIFTNFFFSQHCIIMRICIILHRDQRANFAG